MSEKKKKKSYALEVSLIILAMIGAFMVQRFVANTNPPDNSNSNGGKVTEGGGANGQDETAFSDAKRLDPVPDNYLSNLSDLATEPDWSLLDIYQYTISKDDFVRLLDTVYTIRGEWKKWVEVTDEYAMVRSHVNDESQRYKLSFANDERKEKVTKYWREKSSIKYSDQDLPLQGLRVVIDPGHIGGNYASVEERKFKFGETIPVQEGNLTLTVSKILEQQLISLGAEVDLTRTELTPVNPKRAEDYVNYAKSKMSVTGALMSEDSVARASEKLFYRAGEIRERARIVNSEFKPDVVICVHFNAVAWDETLLEENEHAHMILHGAYTSGELARDDQRFQLMRKLLQRSHEEERKVSASVARSMTLHTGLPPYMYAPESSRALNVDEDPYLWARNLAANRSFECPVVFCEPYLMNGVDSHARIQAGDYEGLRYVNGMLRQSIFREYVNFVAEGFVKYYRDREISE